MTSIGPDAALDHGRLIHLKFRRSAAARAQSLASIRQRPDGQWQARIGGRMRGRTEVFRSRQAAETAVHEHYNTCLMTFIRMRSQ